MTDGRKGKANADALINVLISFAFKGKNAYDTNDRFIDLFIYFHSLFSTEHKQRQFRPVPYWCIRNVNMYSPSKLGQLYFNGCDDEVMLNVLRCQLTC